MVINPEAEQIDTARSYDSNDRLPDVREIQISSCGTIESNEQSKDIIDKSKTIMESQKQSSKNQRNIETSKTVIEQSKELIETPKTILERSK